MTRRTWTWIWRLVAVALTVVLVVWIVVPELSGARDSWHAARQAMPWLLVVALALEVASWSAASQVSRVVMRGDDAPSYWTQWRIDITGNGMSHVVPGGGAAAAALRWRLLSNAGLPARVAVPASTVQAVVNALTLVLIFAVGLLAAGLRSGIDPWLRTGAWVGLGLLVVLGALAMPVMTAPETVVRRAGALLGSLPGVSRATGVRVSRTAVEGLRTAAGDRRTFLVALAWSTLDGLLDAACLWFCIRAFGVETSVPALLAAYGLVNILAVLPLTPGGIGIVEGVLIPTLVTFGVPHAIALLGVLTWRLLQFWLPVPVAAAAYASLRAGVVRQRRSPRRPHA